jgi:hypothetical protein
LELGSPKNSTENMQQCKKKKKKEVAHERLTPIGPISPFPRARSSGPAGSGTENNKNSLNEDLVVIGRHGMR